MRVICCGKRNGTKNEAYPAVNVCQFQQSSYNITKDIIVSRRGQSNIEEVKEVKNDNYQKAESNNKYNEGNPIHFFNVYHFMRIIKRLKTKCKQNQ